MYKFSFNILILLISASCLPSFSAENDTDFEKRCLALKNYQLPNVEIHLAEYAPTKSTALSSLSGHCKIQGNINKRIGIDGKAYAIGFELRLPQQWNSRFFFQGGGGTDGRLMPATGRLAFGSSDNGLARGFAVVSTDAGHIDEKGPTGPYLFALDPQARIDYGYLHLPLVSTVAKELINSFYQQPAKYSYFVGCSNGGRQGMMASQRYPELFNGVLAGAPAYRVVEASVDAARQTQIFASVAPKNESGLPLLGQAFNKQELEIVRNGILQACDKLDGSVDGMVNNISQCQFDPKTVQCGNDNNTRCIAKNKADALSEIYAGAHNSSGELLYSSWPWDPGIGSNMWTMWKLGREGAMPPTAANTTLIAGALSHLFSTPPIQTQDLYDFILNYDIDSDPKKTTQTTDLFKEASVSFVDATSTDLDAFIDKNGKIIFYHGMADAIFSANDTVNYFDKLGKRYGDDRDEMSRLYLIPGMSHCGGGLATDDFDGLSALVDWVENNKAPQEIIAKSGRSTPWPNRSRPLCPFPQQAVYKGSGSIEESSSFKCE